MSDDYTVSSVKYTLLGHEVAETASVRLLRNSHGKELPVLILKNRDDNGLVLSLDKETVNLLSSEMLKAVGAANYQGIVVTDSFLSTLKQTILNLSLDSRDINEPGAKCLLCKTVVTDAYFKKHPEDWHKENCPVTKLKKLSKQLEHYSPWISVQDELPELNDRSVLVHFQNGSIETVHVEDYFKDVRDGFDEDGNELYAKLYNSRDEKITHWMEVPNDPVSSEVKS